MKKLLIALLIMTLTFISVLACAEDSKIGLIEEVFNLDCKVLKTTGEAVFDAPVQINVALPADYNETDDRYAVCYVLDGNSYVSSEADPLGMFAMYENHPDAMPDIIYVGVKYPEGGYRSAIYGAPFDTSFFLCDQNRAILDQRLQGTGDYFFGWIVDTLKPYIDGKYRTLTDADNTGIIGYSSGGSGAMIAAMLNKDVFSKVGAFSPATWLWSNWFYGAVTNSGYNYKYTMPDGAERDYVAAVDGIKRLFVYQGGNDGSAGDANWALHDVENIYSLMKAKGAGSEASRYIYFEEGTHSAEPWKLFNVQCLQMLFSEYVKDASAM